MRAQKGAASAVSAASVSCPLFNFIMQPEFPVNALVLASEALRIANQNSGHDVFRWSFVSETGAPVRATNGMWFAADCSIQEMPPADVLLLFGSNLPTQKNSPELLNALRASARFGAVVGAVDTGAFALAQAGVINPDRDSDVVLHWEAAPLFQERFPGARLKDQIYLVDGAVAHCAGGVAALDMLLDLIGRFTGESLANEIANALVHTRRPMTMQQRTGGAVDSPAHPLSGQILSIMESNLDFPLNLEQLTAEAGVSKRTLYRVCRRMFGEPPMKLYLHIRLQAARNFLFYEELSIKDVADACGFSYPAVFSRVFKSQFGLTPRQFRSDLRRSQNQTMRPEIRRLITPKALEAPVAAVNPRKPRKSDART